MYGYIVRRILATIPVLVVVGLVVFSLLYLAPGDPAAVIAGDLATQDAVDEIRRQLGLDEPFHIRLGVWVWNILHGDLGHSIFSDLPVTRLIGQRVGPTLMLAVSTMSFAIFFAIPMGVVAAWKAGTWIDRFIMIFAVIGFSFPVFVVAYILIFSFSIKLGLFPVQGFTPITKGFIPFLKSITLPSVALGAVYIALIARITRASVIEILNQDYIRTAHSKGLSTFHVLTEHALRCAAVPIVTIIGVGVALLISGVVVTETVFNIPGLGRLTVEAILERDYPVIQGVILIFSAVYVIINLFVDLFYAILDPRIRY
jgi:peptide/nickel transport system permease protein